MRELLRILFRLRLRFVGTRELVRIELMPVRQEPELKAIASGRTRELKRILSQFLFFALIVGLFLPFILVQAGISEAVDYLKTQPQNPWITQALVAAGETDVPTDHLTTVSGNLATDYAKTILAVAAVGEDPATFGNVDYVAQLKSYYTNNQMGDETLLNDDMWSILALASVGEVSSTEATGAKNFLLANQNPDSGWGYAVSGESDTNDTAAAIMALVEAGVSPIDPVITNAIVYLQSAQNNDGGFGWSIGDTSDSGSDSWVISAIYKVGQNPTSWDKGGNNPITHLESLQDTDGGFWWVDPATQPAFNNKAMAAFAVIALSGKSYPVGYYESEGPQPGTYHLRIEGQINTICDTDVTATTALDIVENGAAICGYTYVIQDTAFGPYLSQINDEAAQGMSGWLYFVDNISSAFGAADYILEEGDEVLWYYGEWGWSPTRINLDKTEADPSEVINVLAEYFNSTDWLPIPEATIKIGDTSQTTDAAGQLNLTIMENGIYDVYVETEGFVRSEKVRVTVGDTVSQRVGLQVEVDQSGTGRIGGEAIALVVNPSQINFGKLRPGESASQDVTLSNEGTVDLAIGSTVSGDPVFTLGIKINSENWQTYSDFLAKAEDKSVIVSLAVPESYLASGIKNGELIFWGTAQ